MLQILHVIKNVISYMLLQISVCMILTLIHSICSFTQRLPNILIRFEFNYRNDLFRSSYELIIF